MATVSEMTVRGNVRKIRDASAREDIKTIKSIIYNEMWDIYAQSDSVLNFTANYNDSDYALNFYNYVEAGDYWLICYHDGDAGSATVDRFTIQGHTAEEPSENTRINPGPDCDSSDGWKVAPVTVPFSGYWRCGRTVQGNTNAFKVSNYAICKNNPSLNNSYLNTIARRAASRIFPSYGYKCDFTVSGTTVSFFCTRMIAQYYKGVEEKQTEYAFTMSEAISVPHDSNLVFNIESRELEVITDNNLLPSDEKYIHMFYNTQGNVAGDFRKYIIENSIGMNTTLWAYGSERPKFYIDANKKITVDVTGLHFRYNTEVMEGGRKYRINNGIGASATENTYEVPHDKCLVFDPNRDGDILFVSSTANIGYSQTEQVLFYNSMGSINGPWRIYWLEDQLENKASGSGVPSYYVSHMETQEKKINLQLADLSSGGAFVFITDIHYNSNSLNSPYLVQDVCRKTGITNIQINGDYINKETSGKDAALLQMNRIMNMYKYPDCITFATVGNHEFNNPAAQDTPEALAIQVNAPEMKYAFINPIKNRAGALSNNSNAPLTYWYDDQYAKIRYFVGEVGRGSGINYSSVKWIGKQMESVPEGYGIVIIFHTILGYQIVSDEIQAILQNSVAATTLVNIMDAARAKTSYTYDGTTYDYTGKTFEMIAAFCGDTHVDLDYETTGGVPIICTTTDSFQEEGGLTRTSGTITEQAFDVVVINRTEKKIYCNRIGAGSDRTFIYSE